MTPYGIRQQYAATEHWHAAARHRARPSGRYVLIAIVAFLAVILLIHLLGGGIHTH